MKASISEVYELYENGFRPTYLSEETIFSHENDSVWFIEPQKGVLKLKVGGNESIRYPGYKNWLAFISVVPEYQRQGIAKKLIEEAFAYLSEKGVDHLIISSYDSYEGFKLRPFFHEMGKKFKIKILDEDTY